MGRLNIEYCDLCKEIGDRFDKEITLTNSYPHCYGDDAEKTTGNICADCYEALLSKLKKEFNPIEEKIAPKSKQPKRSKVQPKKSSVVAEDEDGISIVPSNMTNEHINKLKKEMESGPCRHNSGYSLGEDGATRCVDCNEKVFNEIIG